MKMVRSAVAAAALFGAWQAPASAGLDPFLGEIMMIGGNYCPVGWELADGSLLAISSNAALFSLLGTMYGGNGTTTFALPDLRSRVPVGIGNGPGLWPVIQGQMAGQPSTTLTIAELPMHSHGAVSVATSALNASTQIADTTSPDGSQLGQPPAGVAYATSAPYDAMFDAGSVTTSVTTTIGVTGGGQPVDLVQPYTGIRFCIATQGIYPSRP